MLPELSEEEKISYMHHLLSNVLEMSFQMMELQKKTSLRNLQDELRGEGDVIIQKHLRFTLFPVGRVNERV